MTIGDVRVCLYENYLRVLQVDRFHDVSTHRACSVQKIFGGRQLGNVPSPGLVSCLVPEYFYMVYRPSDFRLTVSVCTRNRILPLININCVLYYIILDDLIINHSFKVELPIPI